MLNLKKSLGQNLLIDKNILNKIAELSSINGKVVFEVGPGTGNLTEIILKKKPKKLLLVEKDKRFCQILSKKLDLEKNFIIYNEDILKFNFDKNINPDIVFGNLPYNISTQILAKFIKFNEWPPPFSKIIFMFQKEVADRILAKPNTKKYGRISVLANFRLDIVDSFKISRKCFLPVPDVDSKIIIFSPKTKTNYYIKNIKNLEKITEILFSGRRKMINKAFSKIFKDYEKIANALGINLKKRPAELSCHDIYRITEYYEKNI
ncbi:MAG: ribosomal RNA small subunit methyltransferase A [Pelagibacteraceae bacterium TMED124]|nr:MAG: ribosomal RNA small subunit methyltransferase A [Pelagibacteraceae bacterium TMED124]